MDFLIGVMKWEQMPDIDLYRYKKISILKKEIPCTTKQVIKKGGQNRMIYCVEDERNIRELLIYTLETTGFKARGFGNGTELMKALKEEIPELILLDIMLPGDDGYTILEQLKSMPSVKDVPVIMVTAKEAEFDKVKGLEGGADDYITKPFGMMEFIARVKAVLRRSARQNETRNCITGNFI